MYGNDAVLLCTQAYNNFLPGSLSSQLDYTSKVTAVVSVMLTAADIQGADLSESLALFWHRHPEGAWKKLTTYRLYTYYYGNPLYGRGWYLQPISIILSQQSKPT